MRQTTPGATLSKKQGNGKGCFEQGIPAQQNLASLYSITSGTTGKRMIAETTCGTNTVSLEYYANLRLRKIQSLLRGTDCIVSFRRIELEDFQLGILIDS